MKKKKISVIVSVYNTEKYVEKCIESILNQTYENLELVLVNDGSTDSSSKILSKYKKNPKVILIDNEQNRGLSYSRNVGLQASTGDFIGYIDSDDYIDPNYYELLMKAILKDKSELAICDMKLYFEETGLYQITRGCDSEPSKLNFVNNGLAASACNKLFKRELLEKYPFAEGKVNEDLAVVIPAIVKAKSISYVPEVFYYYVQRNTSIQNSAFSEKRFDIFVGVDSTLERIKGCKNYKEIRDAIIYNQIILLLVYVFPKIEDKKERKRIIKKYGELTKKYDIRLNKYFWKFLDEMGKSSRMYYKMLFRFTCTGHNALANNLMSFMLFYKKVLRANVVKNAQMEDLIDLAQKSLKYSSGGVKISVVIPNYNYERFLYQRMYSILSQKIKFHEILILDDCSSDNSREKIDAIVDSLSPYVSIRKIYNEQNSGSPFKQWQKGFEEASGDYIWIAEADDYCDKRMIKKLIKPIRSSENIRISYCDTAFINTEGKIILPTIKNEIDIMNTGHWDDDYVNNGENELKNYTFLNCTIANVSSALIKKDNYKKYFKMSGEYRQSGDWLFYANIMQHGNIAYIASTYNYYRLHGNNVSSTVKKEAYIKEMTKIYTYFHKLFGLTKKQKREIEKRYKLLQKSWNLEK